MRTSAQSCASNVADAFAGADVCACSCSDNAEMTVKGAVAWMVADDYVVAQDIIVADSADASCHCRSDGSAHASPYIHASVKLTAAAGEGVYSVAVMGSYRAGYRPYK